MKFNRYILRQLVTGFLFSAAGMVFIAMPGIAVGAVHKLGSAGTLSILKFVPMMVAVFVPYVLPVALLLALVSTYGRLASQNEWTAIRMAGLNPYRLLAPAVLLAALAGSGVYALNAELLPRIKVWQKTAQLRELKSALRNLSRGKTEIMIDEFFLSAEDRFREDPNVFYDCFIEFPQEEGQPPRRFFAESVRFEFGEKTMRAVLLQASGATQDISLERSDELVIDVDLEVLLGKDKKHDFRSARYQTSGQLLSNLERIDVERTVARSLVPILGKRRVVKYLEWSDRPRRRLLYSWHQRMANGATCLMFVLVGVSTGVMMRKGTQLSALAVAVGYAMVYWIASLRLGKQLAQGGSIDAWVGAWAPLALFSVIGVWLTHRAFRE